MSRCNALVFATFVLGCAGNPPPAAVPPTSGPPQHYSDTEIRAMLRVIDQEDGDQHKLIIQGAASFPPTTEFSPSGM